MPETLQKYATGSTVLVDGYPWTVVDMSRDSEGLLLGQADRGEDYNLYRLSRKSGASTLKLLRWQHELDQENSSQGIPAFFEALYSYFLQQLEPDEYLVRRACEHLEVARYQSIDETIAQMAVRCQLCEENNHA